MKKLSAAILLCAAIGACNTDSTNSNDNTVIGGPCDYEDTAGVATIVSVEPAGTNGLNCGDDAVEIVFDFTPDDPAAADLAETGLFVAVSEGVNPDRAWAEDEGLTVGSEHPALRVDITSGTCTPLMFTLTDVDYSAGAMACGD